MSDTTTTTSVENTTPKYYKELLITSSVLSVVYILFALYLIFYMLKLEHKNIKFIEKIINPMIVILACLIWFFGIIVNSWQLYNLNEGKYKGITSTQERYVRATGVSGLVIMFLPMIIALIIANSS